MKPYLLFDFDGTIADSIKPMFGLLNKIAPRFNKNPVSWEEFEQLRDMSISQIVKKLKLPMGKLALALPMILNEYHKIVDTLELFPGIRNLLESLSEMGVGFALLSSNRDENVNSFLDKYELKGFDWVEGTDGVLAKQRRLAKMIRKHKLNKDNLFYVGDEYRDIQAARHCKVKIISVSWGLHTRTHLQAANPDYLVDSPQQIVEIVLNQLGDSILA